MQSIGKLGLQVFVGLCIALALCGNSHTASAAEATAANPMVAAAQPSVGTLVYFGSDHCPYCRRFEREVAEIYDKTEMSAQLPLVAVDRDFPAAPYLKLNRKVTFVPSFFIVGDDGKVRARFLGYRGEEFWWGDLESSVEQLKKAVN
uniref:Thioredoxin domain-containing protein n=1 Tax=Magnetococcus massalia (strain MO-1) TaxID=451514 RepID=A0A1S7LLL2_MAGMO|nr:exported protein of unknown function [Candidatus Magnetococcus massalia]